MKHLTKLLRQPSIMPQESLDSFLWRLVMANHYDSISSIKSIVNERVNLIGLDEGFKYPVNKNTYNAIASLCDIPTKRLYEATLNRYAGCINWTEKHKRTIQWDDGTINDLISHEAIRRNCRSTKQMGFCPSCLQEEAYFRLHWHMTAVTSCLEHKCLLVDICQQCDSNLSVQDIITCRCPKCLFDLRLSNSISCEHDESSIIAQKTLLKWLNGDEITPNTYCKGPSKMVE